MVVYQVGIGAIKNLIDFLFRTTQGGYLLASCHAGGVIGRAMHPLVVLVNLHVGRNLWMTKVRCVWTFISFLGIGDGHSLWRESSEAASFGGLFRVLPW